MEYQGYNQRWAWWGRWFIGGWLVGLACLSLIRAVPAVAQALSPPSPISAAGTLSLRWSVPAYTLRPQTGGDGRPYLTLAIPGWPATTDAGRPQLPFTSTLVVLPPTGTVGLEVVPLAQELRPLAQPLLPAPGMAVAREAGSAPQPGVPVWAYDAIAYAAAASPCSPVMLTELGRLRGVRLARLTFTPFCYDPPTGQLHVVRAVEIRLHFPLLADVPSLALPADPLSVALRPLVLNPGRLAAWASAPDVIPMAGRQPAVAAGWQFTATTAGLYALPWELLRAAGVVSATADPALVQLHHAGQELALFWDTTGARFLFYAEPSPTRWAACDSYRVTYGGVPGVRMGSRSGAPAGLPPGTAWTTAWAAENRAYDSLYAAPRDGDHWYWDCLSRPAGGTCGQTATYPLTLTTPVTTGVPATLTLWLQGYTAAALNPDHRVTVALNGTALGEVAWDGKAPVTATFEVPVASLRPGANGISLTLTLTGGIWVDAVALRYPVADSRVLTFTGQVTPAAYTLSGWEPGGQVYDVTDAAAPLVVTGTVGAGQTLTAGDDRAGPRTYLLARPSRVMTVSALLPVQGLAEPVGADYLVVAPTAFITALQPLLALRATQGLTAFVASLEAIYDTYGDGRMDPEAIRTFVAHAYAAWTPRPAYLLLVGDGTWDPLDHLKTGTPTLLPPYLAMADPWLGEVPADNRYAAVDGADGLPDLAVGRLPVNNVAELVAVVDKLVRYETEIAPGNWNLRHLFVADDADPAGDFPAAAAQVAALVPPTHTTVTLTCADDAADPTRCANLSTVRAALLSHWNQGALMINWVGHSSFQQWEHGRLFHIDDLPALTNANRLPVVVEMTCYTGHFAHPVPWQTALDEALVRRPGAGAVAAWGSSGEGVGSDHTALHAALYQGLFGSDAPSLGVATTVARAAQAGGPGAYLVDTYHLFGDPALTLSRISVPWLASLYLPLVEKNSP